MRFFLLLVTFMVMTLPVYSLGGDDDGPPPPRVVSITGESAACSGSAFVYQIEVSNTAQLTLNVTGGTITPVSAPLSFCGGIPSPSQPSSSRLIYTAGNGNCTFAISARIVWNASGTRRLTATSTRGGATNTRTLNFTGSTPTISGPSGPLCVSQFGFTSFFFSSTGPPGASIQWTANGLSVSSPTSSSTNISGFQPSSFYTVQVAYSCPGQSTQTRTLNVQTRALNDPQCGFGNCPPNILCVEPLTDSDQKEKEGEEILPDDGLGGDGVPIGTTVSRVNSQTGTAFKEAITNVKALSVYPNPVRPAENLTVQLPGSVTADFEPAIVRLINFNGRVLYETEVSQPQLSIPMADVPPGGYLIQTIQGKEVTTAKLVVSPRRP